MIGIQIHIEYSIMDDGWMDWRITGSGVIHYVMLIDSNILGYLKFIIYLDR